MGKNRELEYRDTKDTSDQESGDDNNNSSDDEDTNPTPSKSRFSKVKDTNPTKIVLTGGDPLEIHPPKAVRDRFGGAGGNGWLRRQNVLVSATLDSGVQRMAKLSLVNPARINFGIAKTSAVEKDSVKDAKKMKVDAR